MRVTGRGTTVVLALLFGAPGLAALAAPTLIPGLDRQAAAVLCIGALLLGAIAATNRDPMGTDVAPPRITRRYLLELGAAMAAYVLVLWASLWLLKRIEPAPLRGAVALLPLLPIGVAVATMLRYMRALDELQQRIELESLGIATVFVSMLYMTGGLLQSAGLFHVPGEDAMVWVFPLISGVYGIARGFVARRYE